jgi:hypothetical protein
MMKNMIETYDLGQLILSAKKWIYREKSTLEILQLGLQLSLTHWF